MTRAVAHSVDARCTRTHCRLRARSCVRAQLGMIGYLVAVRPYLERHVQWLEVGLHVLETVILAMAVALAGAGANSAVTWGMIGEQAVARRAAPTRALPCRSA